MLLTVLLTKLSATELDKAVGSPAVDERELVSEFVPSTFFSLVLLIKQWFFFFSGGNFA